MAYADDFSMSKHTYDRIVSERLAILLKMETLMQGVSFGIFALFYSP